MVYGTGPATARATSSSCSILEPASRPSRELQRYLPQTRGRFLCLADFFRDRQLAAQGSRRGGVPPGDHGVAGLEGDCQPVRAERYRDYLELHGLSVQLTEALAEMWHARMRADLGFASDDGHGGDDPRPGLPRLAVLLRLSGLSRAGRPAQAGGAAPSERIGVELSEELQLHPEQSTDALIVHHPEAKYFNAR